MGDVCVFFPLIWMLMDVRLMRQHFRVCGNNKRALTVKRRKRTVGWIHWGMYTFS